MKLSFDFLGHNQCPVCYVQISQLYQNTLFGLVPEYHSFLLYGYKAQKIICGAKRWSKTISQKEL